MSRDQVTGGWAPRIRQAVIDLLVILCAVTGCQTASEPVKVGVLHSLSGTMAISETSVRDATLMAIEEINAQGGLLGRKIQPAG